MGRAGVGAGAAEGRDFFLGGGFVVGTNCGAAIGMGSGSGMGIGLVLGAGPVVGGEWQVGWAVRRAGQPKGFLGWLGPWFSRIIQKNGIGICRIRANGVSKRR